jgi:hypothetical protein
MNVLQLIPGLAGKSTPQSAMRYLLDEVEKKIGEKVNALIMEVDFEHENIVFKLPEKKLKETVDSSFMFMIISTALTSYLTDELKDVKIIALIVHHKEGEKLQVEYFYEHEGNKLKNSKTF